MVYLEVEGEGVGRHRLSGSSVRGELGEEGEEGPWEPPFVHETATEGEGVWLGVEHLE